MIHNNSLYSKTLISYIYIHYCWISFVLIVQDIKVDMTRTSMLIKKNRYGPYELVTLIQIPARGPIANFFRLK